MMSQLGPVGTVLSVVFVLFTIVLFLELCYVWLSRHRHRRLQQVAGDQAGSRSRRTTSVVAHCSWPKMICGACCSVRGEESNRWSMAMPLAWRHPFEAKMVQLRSSDAMQEEGKVGKEQQAQGELLLEAEEVEDVLRPWGQRLLFTIKEETKEEMELEEVRCKGSRASSSSSDQQQLLLLTSSSFSGASSCTSPFVTPPSSPPFATPFGSPAPAATPALQLPIASFNSSTHGALFVAVEVDSTSCSTSSSSPLLHAGRRPLSLLFEDTSSFSPSSVTSTPASLSPSAATAASSMSSPSNKRGQRHPLCLLLDPPPSPSSALYHYHINRVHPLSQAGAHNCNVDIDGKPKCSPAKPEPPPHFHIPAPSQPTTPCPFRASLQLAKAGAVTFPSVATSTLQYSCLPNQRVV